MGTVNRGPGWLGRSVLAFALLAAGSSPGWAQQIQVNSADPNTAPQGIVNLDVLVKGRGFKAGAVATWLVTGTAETGGVTVNSTTVVSGTEIRANITIAAGAVVSFYDIAVMNADGRTGKGTERFSVTRGKPNAEPPPTYPPGRYWHAIAANGGKTAAESRLYMFGGASAPDNTITVLNDLWSYSDAGTPNARWTLVQTGTSAPGPRQHVAWSCGEGRCVAANGNTGGGLVADTWVFDEALSSWSQVSCRRLPCPSARQMATFAFDPVRGVHVLFGGKSTVPLSDTFLFDASAMRWRAMGSAYAPTSRNRAAAVFVPPLQRVVMHGGQTYNGASVFSDTYSWDGAGWDAVTQQTADGSAVPSLHSHTLAWDHENARLIVTGGFVDTSNTVNTSTWYVAFSNASGEWVATWTRAAGIVCKAAAGSQDGTIHAGARMAFDAVAGVQVFFGGWQNYPEGIRSFDNTVECR